MLPVIACFLVAVVALLLVPLRVALVADPQAQPRFLLDFSWLFGLVRGQLPRGAEGPPSSKKAAKPRWKKLNLGSGRGSGFLRAIGGIARLREFLSDLIESLRPNVPYMRVELGLDDPADTGQAWAALGPLSAWLAHRYGGRVTLEPSFVGPALVIEGRAQLTLVPLQTLAVLLRYLGSPRTLRGLYQVHRAGPR